MGLEYKQVYGPNEGAFLGVWAFMHQGPGFNPGLEKTGTEWEQRFGAGILGLKAGWQEGWPG